ncbi:TERF1-interacting nuclear factor 2 isoform X3 [Larus michahellis]|uniref:TERF1-interacting nuclear factor 2 isoform X3 n=1 Tax=Larus michahellis TaxID=119627 RepID=UPI003D9BB2EC
MAGKDVSPAVALRLSMAAAWRVVRGRSPARFPRVLALLEAVGRAAPGALHFRHAARLRLGLQAAVVVHMLQEARPAGKILDAIDTFFPEEEVAAGGGHGPASPRDLAMVGEAQESFREMVLGLLADPRRRDAYLQSLPVPSQSPPSPSQCAPVPSQFSFPPPKSLPVPPSCPSHLLNPSQLPLHSSQSLPVPSNPLPVPPSPSQSLPVRTSPLPVALPTP